MSLCKDIFAPPGSSAWFHFSGYPDLKSKTETKRTSDLIILGVKSLSRPVHVLSHRKIIGPCGDWLLNRPASAESRGISVIQSSPHHFIALSLQILLIKTHLSAPSDKKYYLLAIEIISGERKGCGIRNLACF